jgi:prenyltransferase beta subunit
MMHRLAIVCVLVLPSLGFARDPVEQKRATIEFVTALQTPAGGFEGGPKDAKATLHSTIAAVRSLKYLTGKKAAEAVPNFKQTAAFVMACFDPKSGGFADTPGGTPNVALTSIGVMVGVDLDIPKEKFAGAMDYLKENAKTFEDVRIAAAAVEAWGVKDCPFDLKPWFAIADKALGPDGTAGNNDGIPRETASVIAMKLRLGIPRRAMVNANKLDDVLQAGQWPDGGYGREGAKGSDLESTYRVMRAYMLMKERPKNRTGMREFIQRCRNKDGGYGVQPGEPSTASGVYFATIVAKWLDDLEK